MWRQSRQLVSLAPGAPLESPAVRAARVRLTPRVALAVLEPPPLALVVQLLVRVVLSVVLEQQAVLAELKVR